MADPADFHPQNPGKRELPFLMGALDSISEGFQIVDSGWRYLYVNAAAARHGRRRPEELLGRTMMECYPGIERSEMFRVLEGCMKDRTPASLENEFSYPDEGKAWFELRMAPCPEGISIFSIDITERKRLEAQLQRSQKMEAIGRLAGGVAHDFNNILTAINGYGHFLAKSLPPEDPRRADAEEIQKAVERAAALTRQLLTFSRQQVLRPRAVDLNAVVLEMEKMLRRLIGEDISLVASLKEGLGEVKSDPDQLSQVIMNLAVNARDAMPDGGKLTIETDNADLSEEYARTRPEIRPGPHVMLAVSDTGCGMTPEVLSRAFEPFYTTKEPGKGTGLGLSTVYGIVKQSGGSVFVYSEPGHGSTFKIYLPRVAAREAPPAAPQPRAKALGGAETIVLVEDDETVRRFIHRLLSGHGYQVLGFAEPAEALEALKNKGATAHLLLTDIVMPQMRGDELAARAIALHPSLKVLFTSGYTGAGVVRHSLIGPGAAFVQKPISPAVLLGKIRELLDALPAAPNP